MLLYSLERTVADETQYALAWSALDNLDLSFKVRNPFDGMHSIKNVLNDLVQGVVGLEDNVFNLNRAK